jgi:hypothetical protein
MATAVALASMGSLCGQSKLAQVEDPFPAVDCTTYDTGKHIIDKHSDACRSFVQLAKAKDVTLPLFVGPVYACFEINDGLLVIDTAMHQAKNENKKWAALAQPSFAFYRSGIENGLSNLNPPLMMNGKWDMLLAPDIVSYSGTTDNEMVKEFETLNKTTVPHVALSITETSINFMDWEIQTSTGRFRYWTPPDGPSFGAKSIQLTGQCAVFKRDSSSQSDVIHFFWKKTN